MLEGLKTENARVMTPVPPNIDFGNLFPSLNVNVRSFVSLGFKLTAFANSNGL